MHLLSLMAVDIRRCEYWTGLTTDVKNMAASWRKKDAERFNRLLAEKKAQAHLRFDSDRLQLSPSRVTQSQFLPNPDARLVHEPKERIVQTNSFKDKIVQHSLCDEILYPVLSAPFILDNYGSQVGKGTLFVRGDIPRFQAPPG